jgi:5-(carboxyamino)imidazole ribonucleotide synthase
MQKVGILGGGQLGRMLLQAAANYTIETHVLENDPECPAAHLCTQFTLGDIRDYNSVYNFGKNLDALTIEIENVNVDALEKLETEGVKIFPKPAVLRIIKNKVLQKNFYAEHRMPTSEFSIVSSHEEIRKASHLFPAVQKLGEGGYDGRGVQVLQDINSLENAFTKESVLERKINIRKEVAQIVAVGIDGKMAVYPSVEMVVDTRLNQLDYQICPADLDQQVLWKLEAISMAIVRKFQSPGLFAVEYFIDLKNEVLINEIAPRVHNSGHHTIEAHYCSQFDMLWRIILGYPLGNTKLILPSAMVNIIGAESFSGKVKYQGLQEVLSIENAFVHLYGKVETRPGRKMGHVTIISKEKQDLVHNAHKVKQTISVISD